MLSGFTFQMPGGQFETELDESKFQNTSIQKTIEFLKFKKISHKDDEYCFETLEFINHYQGAKTLPITKKVATITTTSKDNGWNHCTPNIIPFHLFQMIKVEDEMTFHTEQRIQILENENKALKQKYQDIQEKFDTIWDFFQGHLHFAEEDKKRIDSEIEKLGLKVKPIEKN